MKKNVDLALQQKTALLLEQNLKLLRYKAKIVHYRVFGRRSVYSREDLLQDALLKLLSSATVDPTLPDEKFQGLCYITLYHTALEHYNKQRRMAERDKRAWQEGVVDDTAEYMELRTELATAVVTYLRPLRQEIVYWHCAGLLHKQIAQRLGIAERTSAWNLVQSRKQLQQVLGIRAAANVN